jgi:hypothetical protein
MGQRQRVAAAAAAALTLGWGASCAPVEERAPSEAELADAYDRGYEDGREDALSEIAEAEQEAEDEEEPDADLDEDEEDADERFETLLEVRHAVAEGLTAEITRVGGISREQFLAQNPDQGDLLDPATQTLFFLDIEASNESGDTVDWPLGQGVLVVGSEQTSTLSTYGETLDGEGWRDGVDQSATLVWELSTPYEEVAPLGRATYEVKGAQPSGELLESLGEDTDIALEWDADAPDEDDPGDDPDEDDDADEDADDEDEDDEDEAEADPDDG